MSDIIDVVLILSFIALIAMTYAHFVPDRPVEDVYQNMLLGFLTLRSVQNRRIK